MAEKTTTFDKAAKQFEVWGANSTPYVSSSEANAQGDLQPGQKRMIRPDRMVTEDRIAAIQAHGFCRHFRLEDGQKQIEYERLWERLKHDEKYDLSWFIVHFKGYGLCDVFQGLAVNATSPGKVPNHYVNSGIAFHLRDKSIICPHWEDRNRRGEKIMAGKYTKRSEV
jgi:hypothetical protein